MKRTLLEVVGQLEALNQQLASAEIELKALINVYRARRFPCRSRTGPRRCHLSPSAPTTWNCWRW